jgi:hypothetical protein
LAEREPAGADRTVMKLARAPALGMPVFERLVTGVMVFGMRVCGVPACEGQIYCMKPWFLRIFQDLNILTRLFRMPSGGSQRQARG